MYEPAEVDVFADQGSASDLGIGALQPAGSSGAGGLDPMTLLRLGRQGLGLFKTFAPETFADATSFIPSWQSLGLPTMADIVGPSTASFLSGLGSTVLGPGALAFGLANLFAAIPNTDGGISYGGGIGSLADGYKHSGGRSAQGLYDQWVGDRGWYDGGDPTGVDLAIDHGSMSRKSTMPYYAVGGVPYRTPELATQSGRSIARGMMGLPVTYEPIPFNAYDPTGASTGAMVDTMRNRSMIPYDAPAALPANWNDMLDIRNQLGTGEGQNSSDVRLDAFMAGLDPRQREFFDAGLNTHQLWNFTGPDMADLPVYAGELDANRNDTAKRLGDAAGITDAKPFDPYSYGFGAGRNFFPDQRQPGKYPG